MRVLIIEDQRSLALEMEDFLKRSGYVCDLAFTAKKAEEMLPDNVFDFVLLDLGLPDRDGLTLLENIRTDCPDASCIILTARGKLEDRIKGLDGGADDYLPKPFSLLELQSRMQAITRRKSGLRDAVVHAGAFIINLNTRTASCKGIDIELSRKEFDLLSYLLLHRNRPLTRLQLGEHIWGSFTDDNYDSNYIDVHIRNIRRKLSPHASAEWLQTIRGVGYKVKL